MQEVVFHGKTLLLVRSHRLPHSLHTTRQEVCVTTSPRGEGMWSYTGSAIRVVQRLSWCERELDCYGFRS